RLAAWIDHGQLVIVERALAEGSDGRVPFFVRTDKNGWSSLFRAVAERDGIASTKIDIETVTIADLIRAYGVPYFLKCDLEGAETLVLRQIAQEPVKPKFVAVEAETRGDHGIDLLAAAGYVRFQIINQGHLRLFRTPNPPREGLFVDQQFHGKMSGLFGEEL